MSEQLRFTLDDDLAPPARLLLCGAGGGGVNAINNYLGQAGTPIETLAVETDPRALQRSRAKGKIPLLGGGGGKVWGTGGDPARGRALTLGATNEILAALQGVDLLFLAASLGGGTGSGAAPVIANLAAQAGVLTISVLTLPRRGEGVKSAARAAAALEETRNHSDAVLVVENDRIFAAETGPVPLLDAFRKADEVLARAVIALTEIIQGAGYINIDFADVERTLRHRGDAVLGIGRGRGPDRLKHAFNAALEHPFVRGGDISKAQCALINLRGDPTGADQAALEELQLAGNAGQEIKFGIIPDPSMGDELELTIVAAGMPLRGETQPAAPAPLSAPNFMLGARPATPQRMSVSAGVERMAAARVFTPPAPPAPQRNSPLPSLEGGKVAAAAAQPDANAGMIVKEAPPAPGASIANVRTEVITSLPPLDPPAAAPGQDPREVPAFLRRRRETV
jgi:cell division protein FtsZ